ncbi:putative solute carrier family 35 member SLC35F1/F2/F6 [Helianthus annuus]|nr:putative solute carrier family 35 member SLC35F1/F2/F6 [Helianthus annuus]KAJ0787542.1 putative solute carrier family 35 member SLC35F1/F2/F6 [Helianthus annuus]
MFLFYSGVPVLLKISGSTMLNLSLLTSDMWSVLIRIFVYREKVDWIYFVAFAAVAVGLVVYSVYVFSFYFSYAIHLFGFGNGLGSNGYIARVDKF